MYSKNSNEVLLLKYYCTLFRRCCVQNTLDVLKCSTETRPQSVREIVAMWTSLSSKGPARRQETRIKLVLRYQHVKISTIFDILVPEDKLIPRVSCRAGALEDQIVHMATISRTD